MENYKENKETFEYWNREVQRLEGELEVAKRKRSSFENQSKNTGEQIEKTTAGYLKGKSGKIFNRIDNNPESSFFRLFNVKNDIGFFEFHGNAAEAIAKRIFGNDSNVCIVISGSERDASSVIIEKPGKVKRAGDRWEVIEPIEVKLV
jgi:hypothetical protein